MILLGDLCCDYMQEDILRLFQTHRDVIVAVRGNCDRADSHITLGFPMPLYQVFDISGKTVLVTHGHLFDESFLPDDVRLDILLSGHTHVPRCETVNGILCCNPGSISFPRAQSHQGYMTLEDNCFHWMNLHGEEYMKYET